jgi:hypothetical protein
MKKARSKKGESAEMAPEYNFESKKGIRGKYYRAYRKGHQVRVHQEDGTVTIKFGGVCKSGLCCDTDG